MGAGEDIRAMLDTMEEHDAVSLSPVERLLLATDGTVTHMLEALTRGPVNVDILNRQVNGSTLTREVVLRRGADGSPLVWARSKVNTYPMDMEMTDALVEGDIGIGDLLRQEYAETRREITGMEPAWEDTTACPDFINDGSVLYLKRTYRVYSGGDRIMTIEEWLPKGLY
jgi:beta-ribofuranosylaminobenzene 5'-phosphate synthase